MTLCGVPTLARSTAQVPNPLREHHITNLCLHKSVVGWYEDLLHEQLEGTRVSHYILYHRMASVLAKNRRWVEAADWELWNREGAVKSKAGIQ